MYKTPDQCEVSIHLTLTTEQRRTHREESYCGPDSENVMATLGWCFVGIKLSKADWIAFLDELDAHNLHALVEAIGPIRHAPAEDS